jgi:hypothetical protein
MVLICHAATPREWREVQFRGRRRRSRNERCGDDPNAQ